MKPIIPIAVLVLLVAIGGIAIYRQVNTKPAQSMKQAAMPSGPAPTGPVARATTPQAPSNVNGAAGVVTTIKPTAQISLVVTAPGNNVTVTNNILTVSGKTAPIAEVYVNDVGVVADAAGIFSAKLTLDEGENYIVVFANDADGNVAEQELSVTYDAGQ